MIFKRTQDYELVRQIMTHPRVYPHITDDGSPEADDYSPIQSDQVWYVLVCEEAVTLGLWMLVPQNSICFEIHTCLLPVAYGGLARRAAELMAAWIWANTPCRRLVTTVPETNRLALRFAVRAGMQEYGRNPKSFMKDGQLLDQLLLGMSRPEGQCQQQSQYRR